MVTKDGEGDPSAARRRVSPYTLMTTLDDPRPKAPVPELRYTAHSTDVLRTVLSTLPPQQRGDAPHASD
ncbi:hypothetical protein OG350_27515 [Streptomyces achromogenes]|uniref:Uncharacterized protein n=1 Tax=Streptomyces achromogenes TaxID=67255 RepID=A0ABZ1KTB0_STRAH